MRDAGVDRFYKPTEFSMQHSWEGHNELIALMKAEELRREASPSGLQAAEVPEEPTTQVYTRRIPSLPEVAQEEIPAADGEPGTYAVDSVRDIVPRNLVVGNPADPGTASARGPRANYAGNDE